MQQRRATRRSHPEPPQRAQRDTIARPQKAIPVGTLGHPSKSKQGHPIQSKGHPSCTLGHPCVHMSTPRSVHRTQLDLASHQQVHRKAPSNPTAIAQWQTRGPWRRAHCQYPCQGGLGLTTKSPMQRHLVI